MDYQRRPGLEEDPETHKNLANRFRSFFASQKDLTIHEPGQTVDLSGRKTFLFPHNGIDWNSLVVLDHAGDFEHAVFYQRTWQPALVFHTAQKGPITLKPYRRSTSFFLSGPEDFSGVFEESFRIDEDSADDFFPVPAVFAFFDFGRGQMETVDFVYRYSLPGSLAFYAPPNTRGRESLEEQMGAFRRLMETDEDGLKRQGILDLALTGSEVNEFGTYMEGILQFNTLVAVDPQEDRYWAAPVY